MSSRNDVGSECNTARRIFWEKCAASAISLLPPENSSFPTYETWHDFGSFYDKLEFAACLADSMLVEWDKRWIVEASDEEEEVTFDSSLDEVLP